MSTIVKTYWTVATQPNVRKAAVETEPFNHRETAVLALLNVRPESHKKRAKIIRYEVHRIEEEPETPPANTLL